MGATIIGFALLLAVDLVPSIRKRRLRAAFALLLFFIPALVLALLQVKGVAVPSLLMWLGDLMQSLGIGY